MPGQGIEQGINRLLHLTIPRRTVIKATAIAGTAATLGVSGCVPVPVKEGLKNLEWKAFTPLERIHKLEQKEHPNGLNPVSELISAASEFYCEELPCEISPEKMVDNISFITADEFIEKYAENYRQRTRRQLSQEDKDRLKRTGLEATAIKGNEIFINREAVDLQIQDVGNDLTRYDLQLMLKGIDIRMAIYKSILFHAFSHINQRTDSYVFPAPVEIELPDDRLLLGEITQGLDLRGINRNNERVDLSGATEAFTEYTANIAGSKSGSYFSIPSIRHYTEGAELVALLHNKADINSKKAINIYNGKHTHEELFRLWGSISRSPDSPNIQGAQKALAAVALTVQRRMTQRDAINFIRSTLSF